MVKRKKRFCFSEKKRVGERGPGMLNTTSTADISFMLLIFFLLTTSMDSDKGLGRMMPPPDPEQQEELQDVDKDNVLVLHLMKDSRLTVNDQEAEIGPSLRNTLKQFVARVGETHIIELRVDRSADYDSYFRLQNQIVTSYKELKNYPQRIQEIVIDE